MSRLNTIARVLAITAAVGGFATSASAQNAYIVHPGSNCRADGQVTEGTNGELTNALNGQNPTDFMTLTCPLAMHAMVGVTAITATVTGAVNRRVGQSFCFLRAVAPDGTIFGGKDEAFATNTGQTRMVDDVSITISLPAGHTPVLRCRLSHKPATDNVATRASITRYTLSY